jgi:hypothetical protein
MRITVRKWYLDCTTPDNTTAVVYAGEASIGWVRFAYFETRVRRASDEPWRIKRVSAAPLARLVDTPEGITLDVPALGISGRWRGRASPLAATLAQGPATRIDWRCPQPCAAVTLRLASGRVLEGTGYAEYLEIDGTTAGLPLRELRWGRFIGGPRHVIWIDWTGERPRRWVFADGLPVDAAVVSREIVEWPTGRVAIDPGDTIQHGLVSETIAGRFSRWLPARVAGATETKWAGPARLCEAAGVTEGRVIHEVVRWR